MRAPIPDGNERLTSSTGLVLLGLLLVETLTTLALRRYLNVRGLTTRRLHHNDATFQIDFDFVDHSLLVRSHDAVPAPSIWPTASPWPNSTSVYTRRLRSLAWTSRSRSGRSECRLTAPFPEDREHASWDRDAIERYGRILDWSDSVFEEFSGWFSCKTSPVHLFWHSFDLAVTRFSGRPAPSIKADIVTQEAYSEEVISFGFWAGDDNVPDAAFYSYTSPEPEGLRDQALPVGDWVASDSGSLAILPYYLVRTARDPRATLLAGWGTSDFESKWCPTPRQLHELQATAAYEFGRPAFVAASAASRRWRAATTICLLDTKDAPGLRSAGASRDRLIESERLGLRRARWE